MYQGTPKHYIYTGLIYRQIFSYTIIILYRVYNYIILQKSNVQSVLCGMKSVMLVTSIECNTVHCI